MQRRGFIGALMGLLPASWVAAREPVRRHLTLSVFVIEPIEMVEYRGQTLTFNSEPVPVGSASDKADMFCLLYGQPETMHEFQERFGSKLPKYGSFHVNTDAEIQILCDAVRKFGADRIDMPYPEHRKAATGRVAKIYEAIEATGVRYE